MSFKITNGGALSTIQDSGRNGHMNSGFSQNGVMDKTSACIANALVGNSSDEAVIEMTFSGITAIINSDCVIALSGGNFSPMINNKPIPMNASVKVNAGEVLRCPQCVNGFRGYLAVNGGFDVPRIMGSASTNLKCKLGGFNGRALANGDVLPIKCSETEYVPRYVQRGQYSTNITVRAVPGPQDFMFTQGALKTFFNEIYTVSGNSDRMGIRLEGEALEAVNGYDIISDGITIGNVQVTASGKPIILLADRQTTGGYAKIASVITPDIPLLAQVKAGDKVHFKEVSIYEAQKLLLEYNKELKNAVDAILRRK